MTNEGCSALLSARADWDSFSTLRRNLQLEQAPRFRSLCYKLSRWRRHKSVLLFRVPCKTYSRHEVLREHLPPGPLGKAGKRALWEAV